MLTYDHTKRISASEALNDEWVMKNRKPTPLNKKVMDNLSSFQVSMALLLSKLLTVYINRLKIN